MLRRHAARSARRLRGRDDESRGDSDGDRDCRGGSEGGGGFGLPGDDGGGQKCAGGVCGDTVGVCVGDGCGAEPGGEIGAVDREVLRRVADDMSEAEGQCDEFEEEERGCDCRRLKVLFHAETLILDSARLPLRLQKRIQLIFHLGEPVAMLSFDANCMRYPSPHAQVASSSRVKARVAEGFSLLKTNPTSCH